MIGLIMDNISQINFASSIKKNETNSVNKTEKHKDPKLWKAVQDFESI